MEMPVLGLGTWQAKGQAVIQAVKWALEIGYRHIDTAWKYENEKEVGKGLHQQIAAGIVKREDVFINTKVWPKESPNHEKALRSIHRSLKMLNVTYLDLVLVHRPEENYSDVYKGLEEAYKQKLVRSIGISNFNPSQIDHLMKTAKVKPAVNQINIHPTLNQDKTVEYCKKLGIQVTGYSPLATGKPVGLRSFKLINNPTLTAIGKKHNKTAAQVAIRWQIQRGIVTIPKSINKSHIKENFNVFDFKLTQDEMKTINAVR